MEPKFIIRSEKLSQLNYEQRLKNKNNKNNYNTLFPLTLCHCLCRLGTFTIKNAWRWNFRSDKYSKRSSWLDEAPAPNGDAWFENSTNIGTSEKIFLRVDVARALSKRYWDFVDSHLSLSPERFQLTHAEIMWLKYACTVFSFTLWHLTCR